MICLDLSKPNLAEANILKAFNVCRPDKVALRRHLHQKRQFKVIKIRKGCQYAGYFYYSENPNWAAQNLRLGRELDIAG